MEKIYPKKLLGTRGTVVISSREDAKNRANMDRQPGELMIYTDGSRDFRGYVGSGWCWKPTQEEFSGGHTEYWEATSEGFEGGFAGLGNRCEVFDAELFAILKALKAAADLRRTKMRDLHTISIFSDAQEALRRIHADDESPGQALARAIWRWESELEGVDIIYNWVPGHEEVPGNEIADIFAKRGADTRSAHPFQRDAKHMWLTYSISNLHRMCTDRSKNTVREWIKKRLQNHRAFKPRRSWVFRPAFKPPWGSAIDGSPVSKSSVAAFFQMACGHAITGSYLKRFHIRDEEGCGWCNGRTKQTRGHLFGQCAGLRQEFNRLCVQANKMRIKSKKKKRSRWKPWMFFQEEGLERVVKEYMRRTGVGFIHRGGAGS